MPQPAGYDRCCEEEISLWAAHSSPALRSAGYVIGQVSNVATVRELAARILDVFRETARSKGAAHISATSLYKMFEGEGSHHMIQEAIRYLLERDFIAPHSYSLTAKGMVKQVGSEKRQDS